MAPLLDAVDAVHVLTSLTGFEALMRGREVTCHGTPFYARWGLTRDLGAVPERRRRRLQLDELVAAVLILYPRYLDPVTGLPCPPEVLVQRMASAQATNRLGWLAPLRRWQGQFMARLR
jgi:capsular polysaccharide export protein